MNIFLDSIIFDGSFEAFRNQVEQSPDKNIDVYISSVGGSVDEGFAIAHYIEAVNLSGSKEITTNILSNADSIATVIALAPTVDMRFIVDSSSMFIHNPRFMSMNDVTSERAAKASDMLKLAEDRIANYYTKKIANLTIEDAKRLMKGEVTLNSDQMIKFGVMGNKLESFNIAALKSNSNTKTMSLFNKKEEKPLNVSTLKIGDTEVAVAYRGDIAVNTEVERIGGGESLKGVALTSEFKITIEDNKITAVEPVGEPAAEPEALKAEEVKNQIAEAIAPVMDMVEKMMDIVDKISNQKSTHQPAKTTVNNAVVIDNPQKDAAIASKGRQKAAYENRLTAMNARTTNFKIK